VTYDVGSRLGNSHVRIAVERPRSAPAPQRHHGRHRQADVRIRNIGPDGKDVCEVGQRGEPLVAVTKGWLRASHRKLDPQRSLPYRPYHAHDERRWLKPGEMVECQVEIWPTSMVFKKGHKLRLDIAPVDGVGSSHFTHYHADYICSRRDPI
jgi:hypothetical protein